MSKYDLADRTKTFALSIIELSDKLPQRRANTVIANQILRSSTSVGANYRAAVRARSEREFYAKICIVVEEVDETGYWLELIQSTHDDETLNLLSVMLECDELIKIFVAMRKTAKARIGV